MKKSGKIISALVLALVLFLNVTGTAQASSGLTFNGQGNEFTFTSGSADQEYPTDLFSDFKNVMPGDTRTEQITIRNNAASRADVRFHLLSSGATEQTNQGFLESLTLTIARSDGTRLYSGPASGTMGEVDLGRLAYGGSIVLTVTLGVPIELGNDFQEAAGHIGWRIRIEEYNDVGTGTTTTTGGGGGGGGGAPADAVLTATPATTAILPPLLPAATTPDAETIEEEETPLAEPGTSEEPEPSTEDNVVIDDEETPLAAPKSWALLNLVLAVLTIVVSAVLLADRFLGKKREEEDEVQEYEDSRLKRKTLVRGLSLLPAAASVVCFVLTENITNPMVLIDKWTLWMVVFATANAALAVLSKKTRQQADI